MYTGTFLLHLTFGTNGFTNKDHSIPQKEIMGCFLSLINQHYDKIICAFSLNWILRRAMWPMGLLIIVVNIEIDYLKWRRTYPRMRSNQRGWNYRQRFIWHIWKWKNSANWNKTKLLDTIENLPCKHAGT